MDQTPPDRADTRGDSEPTLQYVSSWLATRYSCAELARSAKTLHATGYILIKSFCSWPRMQVVKNIGQTRSRNVVRWENVCVVYSTHEYWEGAEHSSGMQAASARKLAFPTQSCLFLCNKTGSSRKQGPQAILSEILLAALDKDRGF